VPATALAASSGRFFPSGVVAASSRMPARPAAHPAEFDADTIPDATGLSAREALALFARLGISVRLEGSGFVMGEQPPAGAIRKPGTVVTLSLSEDAAAASRSGRGQEDTLPANPGP
jgi:hypothetical protein